MVRRLVKYGPGHKRDAGIEWLSRSDFGPDCLGGLGRRRLPAKPGTRVQVRAWSSLKILQKSSKSEKTRRPGVALSRLLASPLHLWSFCHVYRLFCHVFGPFVTFMGHRAPGSVLIHLSGSLKCFLKLLCRFAGDSNAGLQVLS